MRNKEAKEKIIKLVESELKTGNQFIDNDRLINIMRKLVSNDVLSEEERQDLANYVVGQHIGECEGHDYEPLIDWLICHK